MKKDKVLSLTRTIKRLKYIAGSPAEDYGGFSDPDILTARSALHHIRRLRKANKAKRGDYYVVDPAIWR